MPRERETDILIVGAGGAGLCAAVRASEAGARVMVLEKRRVIGGNTILAGGRMNVANTRQQARFGIEDSVERHFRDTHRSGDYVADPRMIWTLVSKAHDALAYMEAHGARFHEDRLTSGTGGIWPRGLISVEKKGKGYVRPFKEAADRLGVEILLKHRATKLVREGWLAGRVLGVTATDQEGEEIFFRAKKAVIMASGGFAGDAAFRIKYDHRWTAEFPSSNYSGCSAEAIVAAADAGADLVGMDYIQSKPGPYDLRTQKSTLLITSVTEDTILVNTDGTRIINSDARRDMLRDAVYEQKGHMAFQLCDERGRLRPDVYGCKGITMEQAEKGVKEGRLFRGDTMRELAQCAGIDPEGLEKTIHEYNGYVEEGHDPVFQTNPIFLKYRLERPPFYTWPVTIRLHFTNGGLRINTKAQVLDRRGEIIPGLYGAGEVTGGVHGANRVGGNALLEAFVFGMMAADEAVGEGV